VRIMALLQRLREQYQMTTLVVTNDVAVAATADRSYRMRDGRVEPLDEPPTPVAEPRPEQA